MTTVPPARHSGPAYLGKRAWGIAGGAIRSGGGLPFALVIGAVVRLLGVFGRPIWYDEAFALMFSAKGPAAMLVGTLSPSGAGAADIHPLGYYTLLWIWMRTLGDSIVSARLLSIFASLATIAIAYELTLILFDRRAARVAALVLAMAPFQVHYGQEIRMYAFLGLWLTLAAYCLQRAVDTSAFHWWLGFSVSAALAQYTHNLAAAYLVALALWQLFTRDWRSLARLTLAGLGALLLYFPWLIHVQAQISRVGQGYWVQAPAAYRLLTLPLLFLANLPVRPEFLGAALFASLGVSALALWAGIRAPMSRTKHFRSALWMLYMSFTPPLLMFLVSLWMPVYLERSFIASGVTFCIWLAGSFASPSLRPPTRWVLASLTALAFGIGLWQHFSYRGFPYAPYEAMDDELRTSLHVNDVIIHSNKLSFLPSAYFDPDLPAMYVADPPGSSTDTLAASTQSVLGIHAAEDIQKAAGNADRVWFALFTQSNQEYVQAGYPRHPHLTWLMLNYRLLETMQWDDLSLYLFSADPPP